MQKTLLGLLSIFLVLLVSGFAVADELGTSGEATGSDGPTGSFESEDSATPETDDPTETSEPSLSDDSSGSAVIPTSDTPTETSEPTLSTDDTTPIIPTSDEPTSTGSGPGFESDGSDSDTPTSDIPTDITPGPILTTQDGPEVANPETENPTPGFSLSAFISALVNPTTDESTETTAAEPASTDVPSGSGDDDEEACQFTCTEWSACSLSGEQTRTCTASDQCSILDDEPATTQSCTPQTTELSQPTEEITTEAAQEPAGSTESAEESVFSRITGAVIGPSGKPTGLGLAAAFILVVVIAYFVVRLRK